MKQVLLKTKSFSYPKLRYHKQTYPVYKSRHIYPDKILENYTKSCAWNSNHLVFEISLYAEDWKVRFSACTFANATLIWCNGHANTIDISTANSMMWGYLKQLLINEYYLRDKIQNVEQEL